MASKANAMGRFKKLSLSALATVLIGLTATFTVGCGIINRVLGRETIEQTYESPYEDTLIDVSPTDTSPRGQFYKKLPSQIAAIYKKKNPSANLSNVKVKAINYASAASFFFTATKQASNSVSEIYVILAIRSSDLKATSYEQLTIAMDNEDIKVISLSEYELIPEKEYDALFKAVKPFLNKKTDLETGLKMVLIGGYRFEEYYQKMISSTQLVYNDKIKTLVVRSDSESSAFSDCNAAITEVILGEVEFTSLDDYLLNLSEKEPEEPEEPEETDENIDEEINGQGDAGQGDGVKGT